MADPKDKIRKEEEEQSPLAQAQDALDSGNLSGQLNQAGNIFLNRYRNKWREPSERKGTSLLGALGPLRRRNRLNSPTEDEDSDGGAPPSGGGPEGGPPPGGRGLGAGLRQGLSAIGNNINGAFRRFRGRRSNGSIIPGQGDNFQFIGSPDNESDMEDNALPLQDFSGPEPEEVDNFARPQQRPGLGDRVREGFRGIGASIRRGGENLKNRLRGRRSQDTSSDMEDSETELQDFSDPDPDNEVDAMFGNLSSGSQTGRSNEPAYTRPGALTMIGQTLRDAGDRVQELFRRDDFTPAQIRAFLPQQMGVFNASSIRAMTPEQKGAFSPEQIGAMTPEQREALNEAQSHGNFTFGDPAFRDSGDEDEDFDLELENPDPMPQQSLGNRVREGFRGIGAGISRGLENLKNLMRRRQPSDESSDVAEGMAQVEDSSISDSDDDISALFRRQSAEPERTQPMVEQPLAGPVRADIFPINNLSDNEIGELSDNEIEGLRPTQIFGMSPEQLRGLSPEQIMRLSPGQIEGLNPANIKVLNDRQIRALSPSATRALSAAHISNMSFGQLGALDSAHLKGDALRAYGEAYDREIETEDPKEEGRLRGLFKRKGGSEREVSDSDFSDDEEFPYTTYKPSSSYEQIEARHKKQEKEANNREQERQRHIRSINDYPMAAGGGEVDGNFKSRILANPYYQRLAREGSSEEISDFLIRAAEDNLRRHREVNNLKPVNEEQLRRMIEENPNEMPEEGANNRAYYNWITGLGGRENPLAKPYNDHSVYLAGLLNPLIGSIPETREDAEGIQGRILNHVNQVYMDRFSRDYNTGQFETDEGVAGIKSRIGEMRRRYEDEFRDRLERDREGDTEGTYEAITEDPKYAKLTEEQKAALYKEYIQDPLEIATGYENRINDGEPYEEIQRDKDFGKLNQMQKDRLRGMAIMMGPLEPKVAPEEEPVETPGEMDYRINRERVIREAREREERLRDEEIHLLRTRLTFIKNNKAHSGEIPKIIARLKQLEGKK